MKDAVFMDVITYLLWELYSILVAGKGFGFGVVCICHWKTRRDRANMANKCQEPRIGLRAGAKYINTSCMSDCFNHAVYIEKIKYNPI